MSQQRIIGLVLMLSSIVFGGYLAWYRITHDANFISLYKAYIAVITVAVVGIAIFAREWE